MERERGEMKEERETEREKVRERRGVEKKDTPVVLSAEEEVEELSFSIVRRL